MKRKSQLAGWEYESYTIGLLVGIRLIFTGWFIAMLELPGDATVDLAKETIQENYSNMKMPGLARSDPEAGE